MKIKTKFWLLHCKRFAISLLLLATLLSPVSQALADSSSAPASSVSSDTTSTDSSSNQTVIAPADPTNNSTTAPSANSTPSPSADDSNNTVTATQPDASNNATNNSSVSTQPTSPQPVNSSTDNSNSQSNSSPSQTKIQPLVSGSGQTNDNYSDQLTKQALPHTDNNTGALIQDIAITAPIGRGNLQPDLKLTYNSQDRDNSNIVGYGWSFNIPYIKRVNTDGLNNIFSENNFTSNVWGDFALTGTTTSTSTFISRTDNGGFLKYSLSNNQWTITDKQGNQYLFGTDASARQDNATSTSQVYKWMLEKETDANGNYISYSYYKDSGQIYPSSIAYTGDATSTGIFSISFQRVSRTDYVPNYQTGFLVSTNYKISEIDVDTNSSWVTKYVLGYGTGDNGNRSVLTSVTESGQSTSGVVTLPPMSFTYQKSIMSWGGGDGNTWTWPSSNQLSIYNVNYVDLNGDGWPDITQSYNDGSSDPTTEYFVGDPQTFQPSTQYENAVSVMVLPYAPDAEYLKHFFRSAHQALKESGSFISISFNPEFKAYGEKIANRIFKKLDRDKVEVNFLGIETGDVKFTAGLTQFSKQDYEVAAQNAGFGTLKQIDLQPTEESLAALGQEFWSKCIKEQPYSLFIAKK